MNDQQLWDKGLRAIEKMLADLQAADRQSLSELLAEYRHEKETLAGITLYVDSGTICRNCAGQCCLNGKYRMSVLDVMACCADGITVFPDFVQKPLCPFGTDLGCAMEPGFRPAGCVFFICDILEGRLSDPERAEMSSGEKAIRECLQKASRLLNVPVATPLLMWVEESRH